MKLLVAAGLLVLAVLPAEGQSTRPPSEPGAHLFHDEVRCAAPSRAPEAAEDRRRAGAVCETDTIRHLLRQLAADFQHLPSRDTVLWFGAGGGLSMLGHRLDKSLNARLVGADSVDNFFDPGKVIGYGVVQIGGAGLTYAVGHWMGQPTVTHLGMDLVRAQAVSQALTLGLKQSIRRQRPDKSSGFAFPSGHTAATFASATVLQRHLGWRAGLPAYLVASYVGVSRMHENRHFLSDVLFGAAVGLVAGRTVTRHTLAGFEVRPVMSPDGDFQIAFTKVLP